MRVKLNLFLSMKAQKCRNNFNYNLQNITNTSGLVVFYPELLYCFMLSMEITLHLWKRKNITKEGFLRIAYYQRQCRGQTKK